MGNSADSNRSVSILFGMFFCMSLDDLSCHNFIFFFINFYAEYVLI